MVIFKYVFFFIQKVTNRVIRSLLNACFVILNIEPSVWLIQNCGVIYKINIAFTRISPHNFLSNSMNIPFQMAHVLKKQKIFCRTESVIKP